MILQSFRIKDNFDQFFLTGRKINYINPRYKMTEFLSSKKIQIAIREVKNIFQRKL